MCLTTIGVKVCPPNKPYAHKGVLVVAWALLFQFIVYMEGSRADTVLHMMDNLVLINCH